jgi:polysaccharide biosynthesis protein PslG
VAAQDISPYGINAHTPEGPAGDLVLDQAQAAGIGWLRIDFSWQDLEPSRGVFRWQVMDALTAAASSRGLRLFASVGGTPAWATDGVPYSGVPRDVADWTDFCTRSVQRYKSSIHAWGFWNEPNLFGSWNGTRQQFIDIILNPGADAVHAADPAARVAGPELAHLIGGGALWYRWLADIIQKMGNRLDVVTHHAYFPSSDAGVTAKLDATTPFGTNPALWDYVPPSVREVLVSAGWFGRPFWLTESGWASNLTGEEAQAANVTGLLDAWLSGAPNRGWVGKIFFYELIDDGRPGIDLFGILRSDLTRKPAYEAYRRFIQVRTPHVAIDVGEGFPVSRESPFRFETRP